MIIFCKSVDSLFNLIFFIWNFLYLSLFYINYFFWCISNIFIVPQIFFPFAFYLVIHTILSYSTLLLKTQTVLCEFFVSFFHLVWFLFLFFASMLVSILFYATTCMGVCDWYKCCLSKYTCICNFCTKILL